MLSRAKQLDIKEGLRETTRLAVNGYTNPPTTITPMTDEEIRRRSESLIENIGALRFSLARIEYLEGYHRLYRALLIDCLIVVEAHAKDTRAPVTDRARTKALIKKMDKVLKETE